jgi:hypothetical protein
MVALPGGEPFAGGWTSGVWSDAKLTVAIQGWPGGRCSIHAIASSTAKSARKVRARGSVVGRGCVFCGVLPEVLYTTGPTKWLL